MKIVGLLIACLVISSCNKKEDEVVSTPKPVTYGTYKSCINDDGLSQEGIVHIDENHITEVNTFFSSSNCQGSSLYSERYVYSATNVDSDYDLTIESAMITPTMAAMTTELNSQNMCGSAWFTNVPKNILGVSCDGETLPRNFSFSAKVYKSDGKLVVDNGDDKFKYSFVGGWNFNQNASVVNGNYIYFDGTMGIYLNISGGNYTSTYFDKTSFKYFTETGTIAASTTLNFTVGTYTPDCGTDEGTTIPYKFSLTSYSAGLKDPDNVALLFEWQPTNISLNDFKSAYLIDTYTAGCF